MCREEQDATRDSREQISDEYTVPGNRGDFCMGNKLTRNDALKDRLSRYREINITVTGRKSGRAISIPVWFALEDDKLYLLPVQGSDTQWYKNVLRNPRIRISARGAEAEFKATIVKDPKVVAAVVDKFREKYGKADVKRYYSKFDAAVVVNLSKGETVSAENDT